MTENYKEDGEAAFKDPPDEEDTSYYMNEIGEQILKYPKITIKIRLSLPVPIIGSVKVSTKVKGSVFPVGETDTCAKSNSPYFDRSPLSFIYYAGVDNHQKVILEIYDGDILGTRSGYCLETVEVYVVDLLRPKTEFPIIIENDLWGSLIVETIYSVHDYDEQVVHIEKLEDEDVSVRTKFAFFTDKPMDEIQVSQELKATGKTVQHKEKFYTMSFKFEDFNPFELKKMIALDVPELQLAVMAVPCGKHVGEVITLWESPWLSRAPFKLQVAGLEKTLKEIVGGAKKSDYAHRYFRVEVRGNNNSAAKGKNKAQPKVLSEVQFPVSLIINGCEADPRILETHPKYKDRFPKYTWGQYFRPARDRVSLLEDEERLKKKVEANEKKVEESKIGGSKKGRGTSFFGEFPSFQKDSKDEMQKDVYDTVEFEPFDDNMDSEEEEETKKISPHHQKAMSRQSSKISDVIDAKGGFLRYLKGGSFGASEDKYLLKGKKRDKCGFVKCKFQIVNKEVDLSEGEDLYIKKVKKMTRQKEEKWRKESARLFADDCKLQALMTSKFIRALEGLRRGWKYDSFVIVDLQNECLRGTFDSFSKLEGEGLQINSKYFNRSIVWQVLRDVFDQFAYLEDKGTMRVFAGGGLSTPLPPKLIQGHETSDPDSAYDGDLEGTYLEGGHPGYGCGRECGFPLTQEVVYSKYSGASSSSFLDPNLGHFMGRSGFNSWGGPDYWKTKRYCSLDQLMGAFCESTTIYSPCVTEEDIRIAEKLENEFELDSKNLGNMRFKSLAAVMEGEKQLRETMRLEVLQRTKSVAGDLFSPKNVNFDVDALEIISGDRPPPMTIQYAVWILCNVPNASEIEKICRICQRYSEIYEIDPRHANNGPAQQALLLVLCPEDCMDHLETSPFRALFSALRKCGLSINEDNQSIVKLELPRLRIILRYTWTMLLSRICAFSISETPSKHSPTGITSDQNEVSQPSVKGSASNKADATVSFAKTQYYDYFGNEIRAMLREHKTTCAAITEKSFLSGIHQEIIQSLREMQNVYEHEMQQLCRRCFEDFIIDTCDLVLVPYKYGEKDEGGDTIFPTPTTSMDCTTGSCVIS